MSLRYFWMHCAGVVLLMLGPGAAGCTNTKENRCATLRKAIRAEMEATREMASRMRDPEALAAHAAFLDSTIGELRGLAIEDAALKKAVATYLNALGKLAGGHRKAADGLKLLHKGDYKRAGDQMAGAGSGLVMIATIVDSLRIRIADACNEP